MNKKLMALSLGIMTAMSSMAFAAPATDFSAGKVSVDVSARPNGDIKVDGNKYDAKTNWEYGLTVGLGNNFAFEYKNFNPKSKDYSDLGPSINGKLDTQEFNVLYKLDKNFTAFTGVNTVKSIYDVSGFGKFEGSSKTNWQLGLTGQTPLGDKFTGYATVAVGADSNYWKIGTSYAIDKNLDFNLFYAQNKYNDVKYTDAFASILGTDKSDYTVKGIGYGLTYKF